MQLLDDIGTSGSYPVAAYRTLFGITKRFQHLKSIEKKERFYAQFL